MCDGLSHGSGTLRAHYSDILCSPATQAERFSSCCKKEVVEC